MLSTHSDPDHIVSLTHLLLVISLGVTGAFTSAPHPQGCPITPASRNLWLTHHSSSQNLQCPPLTARLFPSSDVWGRGIRPAGTSRLCNFVGALYGRKHKMCECNSRLQGLEAARTGEDPEAYSAFVLVCYRLTMRTFLVVGVRGDIPGYHTWLLTVGAFEHDPFFCVSSQLHGGAWSSPGELGRVSFSLIPHFIPKLDFGQGLHARPPDALQEGQAGAAASAPCSESLGQLRAQQRLRRTRVWPAGPCLPAPHTNLSILPGALLTLTLRVASHSRPTYILLGLSVSNRAVSCWLL